MSKAAARLKVGVFGVGSLGQHHTAKYQLIPEAELVGIYDPDTARAHDIAARNHTRAFEDFASLAAAVDAASVVVPTDHHRSVAGALLEQGRHLLIEKPIAANTREAEELVALAQARNLILQVGHIERFNPVLGYLDSIAETPRFIEAHRLAPYPPPRKGLPPRGTEVSVVLDLMIHDLEVILHLVKSPVADVRAVGVSVLSPSEDIANVRLQFENGCVANITASRISPEPMRKIRVFYDDAYISLDYGKQEGVAHKKSKTGITRGAVPIEQGDPLTNELTSFVHCALHHGAPKVSGEHASEALRLATRITHLVSRGAS